MVNNKISQHFLIWEGKTKLCENKVLLRSKQGILIGVFYVFLPKIGAISAFLTTLWIEMMMIEICMVTITLQLCVIIKMKTKSLFFSVCLFLSICASVG